ncbi:PhzF family phenazine biosynthesis protein [Litoribacillus peritrichatus]|uniref:PhzF family phenazine biosynthesis isomerase n=1 Tax=Litoribacillus peritrichatus TaxID=718191 RepID=A0ABP7MVJ5_9GAMM
METGTLYRKSAFTTDPKGGNPAGVWIGETLPEPTEMQNIAAEVGFSETAFVAPKSGKSRKIRFFSPEIEVPFCGHATIATAVTLAELDGEGTFELSTQIGQVPVTVRTVNGQAEAALTSVSPKYKTADDELVSEVLSILGWQHSDLEDRIPPAVAYAGAWHLVIALNKATTLAYLSYDFNDLKAVMIREELTTLQLVYQENETTFVSRNPFPVGGVVEDPATGAAAAAFAGYLREASLITVPAELIIRQGEAMGRPSLLNVTVPETGGIIVKGNAVTIPD